MAHDVFISYSTKDKTIADAICNNLEKNSIRCWIAPRDVLPGKNWGESIDAINDAKILVLVLSSNSNQSSMVMRELERAVSTDTTIIPFRVEEVDPSESISYFISSSQWLDALNPPLEEHIDSLTQTIGKLLNDSSSNVTFYKKLKELILSKISPRKLAISVGAIVIILILVFNFVSPITAGNNYENNIIKFKYPSNWEPVPDIQSPYVAVVKDPYSNGDSGTYNIGVMVARIATSESLSDVKNRIIAGTSNNTKDFQIISDNNTEVVGGVSGYRTEAQACMDDGLSMKFKIIFLQKSGYVYYIICFAPYDEFEKQSSNFKMIIDSFNFK